MRDKITIAIALVIIVGCFVMGVITFLDETTKLFGG